MGEDNKGTRLYACIDGEWHELKLLDASAMAETVTNPPNFVSLMHEITIRGKLRVPKYFRCRNRKRLKKLLMANKISRDEAERMAREVGSSGQSYSDAWWQIWPQLI